MKNKYIIHSSFISLYFFILEIVLKLMTKSSLAFFSLLRIFISCILFSLVINIIIYFLPKKIQKPIYSLLIFGIGIYFFFQIGLFCYIGFFMGVRNFTQGTKVTGFAFDYLKTMKYYHFSFIPIAIVFIIIFMKKIWIDDNNHFSGRKILFFSFFVLFLVCFYCLSICSSFFKDSRQVRSNYSLWKYPDNANLTVSQVGLLMYTFCDIKSTILNDNNHSFSLDEDSSIDYSSDNYNIVISDEVLDRLIGESRSSTKDIYSYIKSAPPSEKNEMTGIFKDKNLIIILLESVNDIGILNQEEFPTLYHLYHEGFHFVNHYSPRNNCATGNNEFTALTSLYPINDVCTVNYYVPNSYYPESIYSYFKEQGYSVNAFHNYSLKYYARDKIQSNIGVGHFYPADELQISYIDNHRDWPSDVQLFKKSKNHYMNDEHFLAYFATVTTHQSYIDSSFYGDLYKCLWDNTNYSERLKRYLSKMKVLDNGLKELLDELEDSGKLDDTVIALFGDHYPYGLRDDDINSYLRDNNSSYEVSRDTAADRNVDRVPFIIYNSKTEGKEINKYTSLVDITPTLLNLFGMDYDSRLYFGTDIFSSSHPSRVYFLDGSWQDNNGFYYSLNNQINYFGDNKYSEDELLKINHELLKRQQISSMVISSNFFEKHYYDLIN